MTTSRVPFPGQTMRRAPCSNDRGHSPSVPRPPRRIGATLIARRGNLELRREPSGLRHYLDGEPVHCGTGLELLLADGRWMSARYECALATTPEGREPTVVLYFTVPVSGRPADGIVVDDDGFETERTYYDPDACIEFPPWGTLRWPERRRW